jgi:hypothetical protein
VPLKRATGELGVKGQFHHVLWKNPGKKKHIGKPWEIHFFGWGFMTG